MLSNREMHIDFSQSAKQNISKSQNGILTGSLECTLDEIALLKFLQTNPTATQVEIAKAIGKSERTVKRMTPTLISKGMLERENGKRNGRWIVKIKL